MQCPKCKKNNEGNAKFCGGCGASMSGVASHGSKDSRDILVGSANDCDIILDAPSVSSHHARIKQQPSGLYSVTDLNSTNGTYYRGEMVSTIEVRVDETLQLGLHPLTMRRVQNAMNSTRIAIEKTIVVGRDDSADIVLPYPVVSSRHIEIASHEGGLRLRDLQSTNGTTVDGRVVSDWVPITTSSDLHLGSMKVPLETLEGWFSLFGGSSPEIKRNFTIPPDGTISIGRDPMCDVVIDASQVSWRHAEVTSVNGRWVIKDLKSRNGVFKNGSRIRTSTLSPDDELRLGSLPVQITSKHIVTDRSAMVGVRLDAFGVSRIVPTPSGPLTILDDVSISVYPGEMVALMGPSGAGKSTMLEVLTGQRPANHGSVTVNGCDLHSNFEQFKDQIGYVPQDDIMHRDLTVFELLFHASQSWEPRRPKDEIDRSVYDVLASMGLSSIAHSLVGGTDNVRGISGGQRKRVNIAIELLKRPNLLFLDEPTSGLDARATMEVVRLLRSLADSGTTIIMTIHQPRIEAYALMDQLLLLTKGGKLAYFGEATPGAANYFSQLSVVLQNDEGNPADYVIDVLDPEESSAARPPAAWQKDFKQSAIYTKYVTRRQSTTASSAQTPLHGAGTRTSALTQLFALTSRYMKRKLRDRSGLFIQLSQAPIVAILLGWIFYDSKLDVFPEPSPAMCAAANISGEAIEAQYMPGLDGVHQVLFLLAATAFWFGCSNVAREIVAERQVFKRERRAGLSPAAYLVSMFSVQTALAATQVAMLVVPTWILVGLHFETVFGAFCVLLLTAISGIAVGLFISSLSKTEVAAIAIVPIILIPQLMFSGYLKFYRLMDVADAGLQLLFSSFTPMRWCFQALMFLEFEATSDLNDCIYDITGSHAVTNIYGFDLFENGEVLFDSAVLITIAILFLAATFIKLRKLSVS
jgi:ABC-type multidrug transport system ATPase subunit/pSer/pThr/pTyr-binding forkhead associated (FHA) protein